VHGAVGAAHQQRKELGRGIDPEVEPLLADGLVELEVLALESRDEGRQRGIGIGPSERGDIASDPGRESPRPANQDPELRPLLAHLQEPWDRRRSALVRGGAAAEQRRRSAPPSTGGALRLWGRAIGCSGGGSVAEQPPARSDARVRPAGPGRD
jgi:hypothetical protein